MTSNENWRRFLDVGASVGQVTLTKANEIAKGLLASESETREQAWRDLDELGRAGRALGEQLAELALDQLGKPWRHGGSLDELRDWFGTLFGHPAGGPESDDASHSVISASASAASVPPSLVDDPDLPKATKKKAKDKDKKKEKARAKKEKARAKKKHTDRSGRADSAPVLIGIADSSERH